MKNELIACAAVLLASPLALAQTASDPNSATHPTNTAVAPTATDPSTTTTSTTTRTTSSSNAASAGATASSSDAAFMTQLAEGDLAEADAGKLAAQKSNTAAVKEFGQEMARDHSRNGNDLKAIAASRGVMLPTSVTAQHADAKARLESLSGANFDREYANSQVRAHEKTVRLLQDEITNGQDQAVKDFATQTLQVVNQHLDEARQMQTTVSNEVASK